MSSFCTSPPMMMKGWFSGLLRAAFTCEEVVSLCVLAAIGDSSGGALGQVTKRVVFVAYTCILALGMFLSSWLNVFWRILVPSRFL